MDIVRVSVPTMDAAEAFKLIKQQVKVPLVADIHFDYRIALKKLLNMVSIVCVLILVLLVMKSVFVKLSVQCRDRVIFPIRIGVNGGH